MNTEQQINHYINEQPEAKRSDLLQLHERIQTLLPDAPLWFLDGRDEKGKIVSNPNIGYGMQQMQYADGSSKPFYQIGISANTAGISVYIMGLKDKTYLQQTYGDTIGKATVTGYCIKFKKLKDINLAVLEAAIADGAQQTNNHQK